MKCVKKYTVLFVLSFIMVMAPVSLCAGTLDYLSRISNWWNSHSLSSSFLTSSDEATEDQPPETEDAEEVSEQEAPVAGVTPGMCKVAQEPPVTVCETGSGFLCVDTPRGGVAGDNIIIRGTIDRQGSVLASVKVSVQNEYTKETAYVDTKSPSLGDCKLDNFSGSFCLDEEGWYAAKVPLGKPGPYTISISASRLSGESIQKKVRASRVVAPKFSKENVSFEPDIGSGKTVTPPHLTVKVGLLDDCKFCDFIGASTGAVTVTAANRIVDEHGFERRIECSTTVEQGGQGSYVIGVPVDTGKNDIDVTVCNDAALPNCISAKGFTFDVSGQSALLETISPPPMPSYDSREYPTIDWKFKIGTNARCVSLSFNREAVKEVCSESGEFGVELLPREGINVATIKVGEDGEEFAWTFGWGRIASPFAERDGLGAEGALGVSVSAHLFKNVLVPLANNFLASDEFLEMFEDIKKGLVEPKEKKNDGDAKDEIKEMIPGCSSGSGGMGASVMNPGEISLGGAIIGTPEFSNGKISVSLDASDLRAEILLSPDKDGDGIGDKSPLPIVVAFKKAKIDLVLEEKLDGDKKLLLVSSSHTDCDYKDSSYCKKTPAALIPQNFTGSATKWGNFIRCDDKKAQKDAAEACRALNSINAQTGYIGEVVLDAINNALYCGGSAALTRLYYSPAGFEVPVGCQNEENCGTAMKLLPKMRIPLGVLLGAGGGVSSAGILTALDLNVGSQKFYDDVPERYRIPQSGTILVGAPLEPEHIAGKDVGVSLSLNAINTLLYAAVSHGDGMNTKGVLDFDIHEPFFNMLGFDFVKECDEFEAIPGEKEKPPALCYIRPRVAQLLGSALTNYGYLNPRHPIMASIRGNRALGPMISIFSPDEVPPIPVTGGMETSESDTPTGSVVEVAIGGSTLSLYALEIDESKPQDKYGNFSLRLDAHGMPIVRPMRQGEIDPMKAPIVGFDLTLLLAMEVSEVHESEDDEGVFGVSIRILSDRSRLVLTPVPGSNTTTIPSKKIISNLAEQIMTALSQYSSKESAIFVKIPNEVLANQPDNDSLFDKIGFKRLSFGDEGITLELDDGKDAVNVSLQVVLEQLLHVAGEEVKYEYK